MSPLGEDLTMRKVSGSSEGYGSEEGLQVKNYCQYGICCLKQIKKWLQLSIIKESLQTTLIYVYFKVLCKSAVCSEERIHANRHLDLGAISCYGFHINLIINIKHYNHDRYFLTDAMAMAMIIHNTGDRDCALQVRHGLHPLRVRIAAV